MRINRHVWGLLAVAGLAFFAGRSGLFSGAETVALAADTKKPKQARVEPSEAERSAMEAEMEAYLKATAPGEHHEMLKEFLGPWDARFTMWMDPDAPPLVSEGVVERELVLGGRFLKEEIEATSAMGPFHAISFMGYNSVDGRYEFVWMDDMSTAIHVGSGVFDPDRNVLRTWYTMRDPITGKLSSTRSETTCGNPDRHTFVEYLTGPDGRERKWMEGELKRRGNM